VTDPSKNFAETDNTTIDVPHGQLEARYERPTGDLRGTALLCHPHPQHGGNMHTKALYHLTRELNTLGFATLRFNFRGVGSSTGSFDGGQGEEDDALHALEALRTRCHTGSLVLGGFSFGAAVGLRVASRDGDVDGLIGIGPPVDLTGFGFLASDSRPLLLIMGNKDQFASSEQLKKQVDETRPNVTVNVIPGAEHLFTGYFEKLREAIRDFFKDGPGNRL